MEEEELYVEAVPLEGSTAARSQKYVSAAFDTLDLTILLLRLENLTGMKGTLFFFLRFICVSTSFRIVFKSETDCNG